MRRSILVLLLAVLVSSCFYHTGHASKEELVQYILNPENSLVKTEQRDGFEVQVLYRPNDLIAEQMTVSKTQPEWDSISRELASYRYFIVKISKDNKELETYAATSPELHLKLIEHLNGGIAQDFVAIFEKDTLEVDQVVYTPFFGSANQTSFMLVFNIGERKPTAIDLVFNDSFFGLGRFVFDYKDLSRIPRLTPNSI
jgi:hypothetical protein